jgi:hypothetical protein
VRLASSENFHTVQINEFQFKPSLRIFQRFAGFWHIARALPIYGPAGDITRWIGTNTDIEDQKNTAEALAHLNETLEQRVEERTAELLAAQDALRRFAGGRNLPRNCCPLVGVSRWLHELSTSADSSGTSRSVIHINGTEFTSGLDHIGLAGRHSRRLATKLACWS